MFPKVTRDMKEFCDLEGKTMSIPSLPYANGYCGRKSIWYKKPNPITILHELIHFFFTTIFPRNNASTLLFKDFLSGIHDFTNGVLRYTEWRKNIHRAFKEYITLPFNDWLDWVLCR